MSENDHKDTPFEEDKSIINSELSQMSQFEFGMPSLSLASQSTVVTNDEQVLSQLMSQTVLSQNLSQDTSQDYENITQDYENNTQNDSQFFDGMKSLDDLTIDQIEHENNEQDEEELPEHACKYSKFLKLLIF